MSVSPEKEKALADRMTRLGVSESDFKETFIRSSGPGGQNVNKVSSCVFLIHIPTGLSVKCQQERSQAMNRHLARRLLLDRIERLHTGRVEAEKKRIEKIKRQKRRRSKRAQEKILKAKHMQSEKKAHRGKVSMDGNE
ncbi:MAG: peptide chain release factor-like protein [Deltaproteobacteria bacterium]|nr:peptide chain release factor-like protein [Deltaproteobacteria bacterium]